MKSNKLITMRINNNKNLLTITKNKIKNLNVLINKTFTQLYFLNLFIKINLFIQSNDIKKKHKY